MGGLAAPVAAIPSGDGAVPTRRSHQTDLPRPGDCASWSVAGFVVPPPNCTGRAWIPRGPPRVPREPLGRGCRNAAHLWRELRETGWRGSQRVVGEWASRQRLVTPAQRTCDPARAPFAIPSVRRTARMLATDLEKLAPSERRFIEQLLAASPQIAKARNLALRFAAIVRIHDADQLKPWLVEAKDSRTRIFCPRPRTGCRCRPRRADPALEQRPSRRTDHQAQAHQAADLWRRQTRPSPSPPREAA